MDFNGLISEQDRTRSAILIQRKLNHETVEGEFGDLIGSLSDSLTSEAQSASEGKCARERTARRRAPKMTDLEGRRLKHRIATLTLALDETRCEMDGACARFHEGGKVGPTNELIRLAD